MASVTSKIVTADSTNVHTIGSSAITRSNSVKKPKKMDKKSTLKKKQLRFFTVFLSNRTLKNRQKTPTPILPKSVNGRMET